MEQQKSLEPDISLDTIKKLWTFRGIKKKNMCVKTEKFPELAQQHEQNLYRFKSVNPLVLSQQLGKKDTYATNNYRNKKHMSNSAQGQFHLSFIKAYLINQFEGQAQQNQKKQQHKQHKLLHSQAQLDKINYYKYQMGEIHIDNYLHSILSRIHKSQRNPRHKGRQITYDIVDQQLSLQQNNSAISYEYLPQWYSQQFTNNIKTPQYVESEGTQVVKRKSTNAKLQKQISQMNNGSSLPNNFTNGNKRKSHSTSDKQNNKSLKKNSSINKNNLNGNTEQPNVENTEFTCSCCFCKMQTQLSNFNIEEVALLQLKLNNNKLGKKKTRLVMQILEQHQQNLWDAEIVICGHEDCTIFMHINCATNFRSNILDIGNALLCLNHQSNAINEKIRLQQEENPDVQNAQLILPIKPYHRLLVDGKLQQFDQNGATEPMEVDRSHEEQQPAQNLDSDLQKETETKTQSQSQITSSTQKDTNQKAQAEKIQEQAPTQMEGIVQDQNNSMQT